MFDLIGEKPLVAPSRNWTYYELVPPKILPLDVTDLRSHLRLDWIDDNQETYLNLLINTVTRYAEKSMGRRLITSTWRTYRDDFNSEIVIELQQNPFQSLVEFKYYNTDGALIDVGLPPTSLYFITDDPNGYVQIALQPNKLWAQDVQARLQAVRIDFKVGYGDAKESVPADIRGAMLQHIAFLYANRGDSDVAGSMGAGGSDVSSSSLDAVPNAAKLVYHQNKIMNISANNVFRI